MNFGFYHLYNTINIKEKPSKKRVYKLNRKFKGENKAVVKCILFSLCLTNGNIVYNNSEYLNPSKEDIGCQIF